MSPVWIMPSRFYYCGFCKIWYGGRDGELVVVPNPNQDKIDEFTNKVEDPIFEDGAESEAGDGAVHDSQTTSGES